MSNRALEGWLGVEPRHLVTFVAVAETGSFRRAAEALGYVQSAVSQQVAQLERASQSVLIDRGRRNGDVRLTLAGIALLDHARGVVDRLRAASADLACLKGEGAILVAVEPAAASLLPAFVARLSELRPGLRLSVREAPAALHADLIAVGSVDLGVGCFATVGPGLCERQSHVDHWVLAVPTASKVDPDSLDSLAGLRGLRIVEDRSHPLPWAPAQLDLEIVASCDRLAVTLDLVRAGVGGAIVPGLAAGEGQPGVRMVDLRRVLPPRIISVIWPKARRMPDAAAAFELVADPPGSDACDSTIEGVA